MVFGCSLSSVWPRRDARSENNFFLVQLGTRTLHVTDDVCHPSLVRHESSEMWCLARIIFGKALDLAEVVLRTLARQETKVTVTRSFELVVRHCF